MKWYLRVFQRYAEFSGRSRRSEYWFFVLFNAIAAFVLQAIMLAGAAGDSATFAMLGTFLYFGYALAALIPSVAVCVRRLHDVGKSGWNLLLAFIPIVGAIIILVWYFTDSQPGENKWGKNPKEWNTRGN